MTQEIHAFKAFILDPPLKRPFLSNVDRFPPIQSLAKLPGPGFYDPSDSLIINESFNSKGYGNSFVSQSQRFPAQIKNTGPGPGAYHESSASIFKKRINMRKSPIFHTRNSKNRFTKMTEVPGPGVYNGKKTRKNIPCAKYVFSSKVERLGGNNLWDTPSPGHYEIKREFERKKGLKIKNSSFFLNPTIEENKKEKNEKDLLEQIKNFKDPFISINSEQNSRKIDFKNKNFLKKIEHKKLQLSLFEQEEMRENKKGFPGPGSYIKIEVSKQKNAVSGAVFKSESDRGAKIRSDFDNLGPGSYKSLAPLKKKNFHYNMRQSWV